MEVSHQPFFSYTIHLNHLTIHFVARYCVKITPISAYQFQNEVHLVSHQLKPEYFSFARSTIFVIGKIAPVTFEMWVIAIIFVYLL